MLRYVLRCYDMSYHVMFFDVITIRVSTCEYCNHQWEAYHFIEKHVNLRNPCIHPCTSFAGQYELHSIVTHKGRSADSGHYIGWARQEPGSDYWWKYDDEVVTETTTEEVMKLKGGGDRDIAYLMFYRFKDFKSL